MSKRHHQIHPELADRLLGGGTDPEDLAGNLRSVAALLNEAAVAGASEPSPALLAAMAEQARTATPSDKRKSPMLAKVLTAKVAAIAAVATLFATGAAAATGSLPDAAQDGLGKAASHIGINLPDSAADRARQETEDHGATADNATSEDHGATADNHGKDVSTVATETEATGADKGAEISTEARNGHGEAPTPPDSTPAEGYRQEPLPPGREAFPGDVFSPPGRPTETAAPLSDGSTNASDHPTVDAHPPG